MANSYRKKNKKNLNIKKYNNDLYSYEENSSKLNKEKNINTTIIDREKLDIRDIKKALEKTYINSNSSNKKKRKKRKLRRWVYYLFLIFFSFIFIFSFFKLYKWYDDNKKIQKLEKTTNQTKLKEVKTNIKNKEELVNPPENKKNDYWYYIDMPFYEVDFDDLLKKNNDTVAFIHMKSTNINYPVVQAKDNSYYLNHAFDKSKNNAGWVFMDYRNNINNLSDNTIIYGHGRINNTIFGSLKNALTKSWQNNKDNYVIWLSTPKKNMIYQIFSIYTIESESYYITTNFDSKDDKLKWINTMKKRNIAPIDTIVDANDNVITLSTCKNNMGERIVVHAKLIKKQIR